MSSEVLTARIRLICPDRPGSGDSTFDPDRAIKDWVGNVEALADELRIQRFVVTGSSGGGPYVLACAAELPERLMGAYVLCGVGPLDTAEPRAALNPLNRAPFEAAAEGRCGAKPILDALLGLVEPSAGGDDGSAPEEAVPFPVEDIAAIQKDPSLGEWKGQSFAMMSARGSVGLTHEMWLYTRPWDIDLASITIPVEFHAAGRDINTSAGPIEEMRRAVPGSRLKFWPDEGHMASFVHLADVFDEVAQQAQAASGS